MELLNVWGFIFLFRNFLLDQVDEWPQWVYMCVTCFLDRLVEIKFKHKLFILPNMIPSFICSHLYILFCSASKLDIILKKCTRFLFSLLLLSDWIFFHYDHSYSYCGWWWTTVIICVKLKMMKCHTNHYFLMQMCHFRDKEGFLLNGIDHWVRRYCLFWANAWILSSISLLKPIIMCHRFRCLFFN